MKDLSKVIKRPMITEQGGMMREMHNQYTATRTTKRAAPFNTG